MAVRCLTPIGIHGGAPERLRRSLADAEAERPPASPDAPSLR
jgi:hypothetical protein